MIIRYAGKNNEIRFILGDNMVITQKNGGVAHTEFYFNDFLGIVGEVHSFNPSDDYKITGVDVGDAGVETERYSMSGVIEFVRGDLTGRHGRLHIRGNEVDNTDVYMVQYIQEVTGIVWHGITVESSVALPQPVVVQGAGQAFWDDVRHKIYVQTGEVVYVDVGPDKVVIKTAQEAMLERTTVVAGRGVTLQQNEAAARLLSINTELRGLGDWGYNIVSHLELGRNGALLSKAQGTNMVQDIFSAEATVNASTDSRGMLERMVIVVMFADVRVGDAIDVTVPQKAQNKGGHDTAKSNKSGRWVVDEYQHMFHADGTEETRLALLRPQKEGK